MDDQSTNNQPINTTTPTPAPKKRSPIALIILIAVVVIGVGAGLIYANWYNNGPCGVKSIRTSLDLLTEQLETFDDALQIANSTGRISLSGPIADLQEISRDTDKLEVTECLIPARSWLVYSMDKYTTAFLKFASNEDDGVVSAWFSGGTSALSSYTDEIIRIQECAPNCEPGTMPAGVPGY